MIKKYRKKPVVIEALQWTGYNLEECKQFLGASFCGHHQERTPNGKNEITVFTLEGTHKASCRDYLIKGIQGEMYPCKPSIFEASYEEISNDED